MATVNFSIPDDIKNRFNQVFKNENKSHLIARLMKGAIEDQERKQRRARAIDELLKIRKKQKIVSKKTIDIARREGRL